MQRQKESKLRALMRRAFVEREFYLRVDGRVRYLRLGSRVQMLAATALVATGVWVCYASFQTVLHKQIVEAKDNEIEQSRLAYVDLLDQVNSYHSQYAEVIESLENNQAFLLNMMEDEKAEILDRDEIQRRIVRSKQAREEIVTARDDIEERLREAESSLSAQGEVGQRIQDQIAQIKSLLAVTEAERAQVMKARDRLADQLSAVQSRLSETEESKRGLATTVDQLAQELNKSKADRTQLSAAQLALSVQVGRLQANLINSRQREVSLENQITSIEQNLDDAVALGTQLSGERDELLGRVSGLEARLAGLRSTQDAVVARLTSQTQLSIGALESAITTAGLEPERLLSQYSRTSSAQGGPFVPADGVGANYTDLTEELPQELTVAALDAHMNRWQALQQIMRALPFSPPVDNYRLTSKFGVRKDPMNGRRARHNGLDFAAPIGSDVLATAPGKVVHAGWYGRYGRMVEIDHGYGIRTRVAHLRKIYVKAGQTVKFRDKIGMQGSSGRSQGPHVHYEIRVGGKPIDPMNFLKAGRNVFKG